MERSLFGFALLTGLTVWLVGLLALLRGKREQISPQVIRSHFAPLFALVVSGLVFLATLPSHAPFAGGQGFGKAFLLGAVGALMSYLAARHAHRTNARGGGTGETNAAVAVAASFGAGVGLLAVPMLWMRNTLLDSLLGVTIGWFVGSLVMYAGLRREEARWNAQNPHSPALPQSLLLIPAIGFVIAVCAVAILGELRQPVSLAVKYQLIHWSGPGMAMAALTALILLIAGIPGGFYAVAGSRLPLTGWLVGVSGRLSPGDAAQSGARGWRLLAAVILTLLTAKLIATKMISQNQLFLIVALGLGVTLAAWWTLTTPLRSGRRGGEGTLAVLLLLAGFLVAYPMLAGFGMALMTLPVFLLAGLAVGLTPETGPDSLDDEEAASNPALPLLLAGLFGAAFLLYRVFVTRFGDDTRGVGLTDQYALFSFAIGALIPSLLAGNLQRTERSANGGFAIRLIVAGGLTLLLPAAVLVVWGAKATLGLLMGLSLAVVLTNRESTQTEPEQIARPLLAALLALAVGLALAQWTEHLMPWTLLTRDQRIGIIRWLTGSGVILLLLSEAANRFGGDSDRNATGNAARGGAR